MKRALSVIIACLILWPGFVQAQKRRTPSRKSRSAAARTNPSLGVRVGAERVAEQIKVLSKFLYLLGGVSKGIEAADAAAQRGEASRAILDQTQRNKNTVRNSIRNMREGLDELEIDFRVKPELQPYYARLAGVASDAATAEEEASANRFDSAGRTLLEVVNRLADVLLEMR